MRNAWVETLPVADATRLLYQLLADLAAEVYWRNGPPYHDISIYHCIPLPRQVGAQVLSIKHFSEKDCDKLHVLLREVHIIVYHCISSPSCRKAPHTAGDMYIIVYD